LKGISHRGARWVLSLLTETFFLFSLLPASAQTQPPPPPITVLSPVVVTASGVDEPLAAAPQTVRVYDQDAIDAAHPTNLGDLLIQNSFGSTTSFSPGQTLFNIRGGSSGVGQGWDDTSEVTVLINGRPAGTANLGKLSTYDIERVEVLRGPASVIYGSSAMGGVINLITKDGETAPGSRVEGTFGSYDRYSGTFESGGKEKAFDWYVEGTGFTSGNYQSGAGSVGTMPDTAYNQANLDLHLGYDFNDTNRLDFTVRNDGVYDAGHPGVTLSTTDSDNRYNTSIEADYTGSTSHGDLSWTEHPYFVQDVDEYDWSQNPLIGAVGHAVGYDGLPGIAVDDDIRRESLFGDKASTVWKPIDSNSLLAGVDLRYTSIYNTRTRVAAPGYPQAFVNAGVLSPVDLPPTEYNSESYSTGVYEEDTQKFLDDKLALSAGARFDFINQKLLGTEFQTTAFNSQARNSAAPTYRIGATYDAAPWLTLRSSVGTAFLAASPTEINASTEQGNGVTINGNPALKDETSLGWEFGGHAARGPFSSDLAYFENHINNRITTIPTANPLVYTWGNVPHDTARGVDFQAAYDLAQPAGWTGYRFEPYATGTYYFEFEQSGTVPGITLTDNHMGMMDQYNATIGLRGGKPGKWSTDWYAVWNGPSYEINSTQNVPAPATGGPLYVSKLGSFWVFDNRESYQVTKNVSLFFGINNLFNLDYDPYFIVHNDSGSAIPSYDREGGLGSSQPGRNFFGGFAVSF